MCRSTIDGGRRCPSHTDPVLIANRNARRRAKYAKSSSKVDKNTGGFAKIVEHASTSSLIREHNIFKKTEESVTDLAPEQWFTEYAANPENAFGVSSKMYGGYYAEMNYFSRVQNSGQIDYTKLDDESYKEFGFQNPEEDRPSALSRNTLMRLSRKELKGATIGEVDALHLYTGNSYKWINGAMYSASKDASRKYLIEGQDSVDHTKHHEYSILIDEELSSYRNHQYVSTEMRTKAHFAEIVDNIDRGLEKTPNQQRILYRGMKVNHSAFKNMGISDYVDGNYPLGQEVEFDGFQSASYSPGVGARYSDDDGLIFEIKTPSGVNVTGVSEFPNESEVLLPRNSRYMVVGVHKNVERYGYKESHFTGSKQDVTVVQLVEITDNGYVKDETNFSHPPAFNANNVRIAKNSEEQIK